MRASRTFGLGLAAAGLAFALAGGSYPLHGGCRGIASLKTCVLSQSERAIPAALESERYCGVAHSDEAGSLLALDARETGCAYFRSISSIL